MKYRPTEYCHTSLEITVERPPITLCALSIQSSFQADMMWDTKLDLLVV